MRTTAILNALRERPHTRPELLHITDATLPQLADTVKWLRRRGYQITYDRKSQVYTLAWAPPPGVYYHHRHRYWCHRTWDGGLSGPYRNPEQAAEMLQKWMDLVPDVYRKLTL